ncbi:MAG: hypothetical protein ABEJ28_04615 [Salinigranum sp.]
MRRRTFIAAVGSAGVAGFGGCSAPPTGDSGTRPSATTDRPETPTPATTDGPGTQSSAPTDRPSARVRNPDFESGLDGWTPGRDVPTDPNTGRPVASRVAVSSDRAASGDRSLALSIDGRQDDGTVWVQQRVDFSGVTALAVSVYAPGESFNTITKVAAYAGPTPAGGTLREELFDTTRPVEDHAGWKTYEYAVGADGAGLLAVGVSVVWETEVTRYLDDVRLK